MDETLSEEYCEKSSLQCGGFVSGGVLAKDRDDSIRTFVGDGDRLESATRRKEYFGDEMAGREIWKGDGRMSGHKAIESILAVYRAAGRRDEPIIFSLTGNVLCADQEMFFKVGSPACDSLKMRHTTSNHYL